MIATKKRPRLIPAIFLSFPTRYPYFGPGKHTHYHPFSKPQITNSTRPLQSFPAALIALSPSTSTHHPSPPLVPSANPPTAAPSHSLSANSSSSSPKLPGCNHTALTPASFASFNNSLVTLGGVMTLKLVLAGSESLEGEETVV